MDITMLRSSIAAALSSLNSVDLIGHPKQIQPPTRNKSIRTTVSGTPFPKTKPKYNPKTGKKEPWIDLQKSGILHSSSGLSGYRVKSPPSFNG